MKHILDEPVISLYPTAAVILGSSDRAIVFQQVHFLISAAEKDQRSFNFVDGKWWVYNTYAQWKSKYFPWMSEDTIQRIFLFLEEKMIIRSMQSVKNPGDRTKWYTIDESEWETMISSHITAKCDDGSPQNATMIITAKCDDDSTETPTETTTNKNNKPQKKPAAAPETHTGLKSFKASAEKFSGDSNPRPAKLKVQPWLAVELANRIFNKPHLAKAKLPLIQAECDLADTDSIYKQWVEEAFIPSQITMKDGKRIYDRKMDDVIALLKRADGLEKFRQVHAPADGSVDFETAFGDALWNDIL